MSDKDKSVVKLSDYKIGEKESGKKNTNTETIECPKFLSKSAKKHWNKVVADLLELNIARDLDTDLIALYCSTYALFREQDKLLTSGESKVIAKTPNGYAQLSAEYIVWGKLSDQLVKIGNKLGLNPVSRASMKFMKDAEKDDLFDM